MSAFINLRARTRSPTFSSREILAADNYAKDQDLRILHALDTFTLSSGIPLAWFWLTRSAAICCAAGG